ncbi:endonuclease/exonuclease/phosphatase family protein [Haloferax sp. DFSO60]|uniref:endonuclease/exonuclease/phosphatase family protein n=1 Tax=Haloferax sp. DFSO60 TaxID=3388652 RepID=UPI003979ABF1
MAATAAATSATNVQSLPVRVATQNLGLGVSLFPLFRADGERERRVLVGDMYESVRDSDVPQRMAALAEDFVEVGADVIAVQEAAVIAAEGDEIDFLAELSAALDARDSGYRVAVSSVSTDALLPAEIDGQETTVRLRDRDALLVAEDVSVEDTSKSTFENAVPVLFSESESFQLARGFAHASVTVPGAPVFDVVSTHLERASEAIRTAQAEELVSWARDRPAHLVVAGDVNDEPGNGAYTTFSAALEPATESVSPTCCRASDLSGGDLSRAIDHVFSRGFAPLSAQRFSLDSADRVETDRGHLWPSDHAGVVTELEATEMVAKTTTVQPSNMTAEPTTGPPESSPTAENTTTTSDSSSTETPGFGIVTTVVALAAAARIQRSD